MTLHRMGLDLSAGPSVGPAAAERAALSDLLTELGPDAPTACDGWTTSQLAAHLVVREGRPDALAGILMPPLHGYTAKLEQATHEGVPFSELVRRIRNGPPFGRTPMGLPYLDEPFNLHEYFVHHEDVRRAQPGWAAREPSAQLEAGLWSRLRLLAPLLFVKVRGVRLSLETPQGRRRTVGRGDEVTVTGSVQELFLFAFGRRGVAEVHLGGSVAGQAKLAGASLGV